MGQELLETVAILLSGTYEDYDVITDKLEQEFNNVFLLNLSPFKVKRYLGYRFLYNVRLTISIYSKDRDNVMRKSSELFDLLEVIRFRNEYIRGVDYSFRVFRDVGQVNITYRIWEHNYKEEPVMRKLKYRGGRVEKK